MLTQITFLFAALLLSAPGAAASPLEARAFTLPKKTLPNGAYNPFFPCGTDPSTCPYRCYALPSATTSSTSDGLTMLQPKCYTLQEAANFVNLTMHPKSQGHACVKCATPLAVEIPRSSDSPLNCQPLRTYFQSTASTGENALEEYPTFQTLMKPYPPATLPSRCGSRTHPIPQCAWECAEAQVPFSVCDSKNTTGEFRSCNRCIHQCSSPEPVVFRGGAASTSGAPNISNEGRCPRGPASVLCPWLCTQAGRASGNGNGATSFKFCAVVDKSDGDFTTCNRCS